MKKNFTLFLILLSINNIIFCQRMFEKTSFPVEFGEVKKMCTIDEKMFAYGPHGLWEYIEKEDLWIPIFDQKYVSSFCKNNDKYFLSSYEDGVFMSLDLIRWDAINTGLPNKNVNNISSSESGIYAAYNGGLAKWNEVAFFWEAENIEIVSHYDKNIYFVQHRGENTYAFGCENIYKKDNADNNWVNINFEFERCAKDVTLKNNGEIAFSTGGVKSYTLDIDDKVSLINTSHNQILDNPTSIRAINDMLFTVFDLNYFEDDKIFDAIGEVLTDIIIFRESYYISTANNGIWREINPEAGIRAANNHFQYSYYPNPSSGNFTLCLENIKCNNNSFEFSLSDVTGKIISQSIENINLNEIVCNNYFIQNSGIFQITISNEITSVKNKILIIK